MVLGTTRPDEVLARAAASGIAARALGRAGGERLVIGSLVDVAVAEAVAAWRHALPDALGQPPAA